jgi:hypothetical protein
MVSLVRLSCVIATMCIFYASAFAHGGGLDQMGCHHDRKRGGYHCHRGPLAGYGFSSKNDALRVLEGMAKQESKPPLEAPRAASPSR